MNADQSQGQAGKENTRRLWTKNEEEALLNILDEIVAGGDARDNCSFKPGTLTTLEKRLSELCPGCDIRANPHIESKLRKWKKQYGIIYDMLHKSGFGWNDMKKCVEIDSDEAWNSYVQANKDAKGWREKPFPLYDRLVSIFGKDHAIGKQAESPAEMVENINNNDNEGDPLDIDDPSSPNLVHNDHLVGRKRARPSTIISLPKMSVTFKDIMDHSFSKMEVMLSKLVPNTNDDESDIAADLETMGLSIEDELEALSAILDRPANVKQFRMLKGARRDAYVAKLLQEKAKHSSTFTLSAI